MSNCKTVADYYWRRQHTSHYEESLHQADVVLRAEDGSAGAE
jgi:hypothetical protein